MRTFHQRQHVRISKYGKLFKAGQKPYSGVHLLSSKPGARLQLNPYEPNSKARRLLKQGKLPPPPKFVTLTHPKSTKMIGVPRAIKITKLRSYDNHAAIVPIRVQQKQANYFRAMTKSLRKGNLPPPEVTVRRSFVAKHTVLEGRHRLTTAAAAGYTYTWIAPMTYVRKEHR